MTRSQKVTAGFIALSIGAVAAYKLLVPPYKLRRSVSIREATVRR